MQVRKLFDGHGAGLEKPTKIGGEIGHGRFQQDPAAGIVNVPQPRQRRGAGIDRRMLEQRCEIGVGFDLPGTNQCRGLGEPRRFLLVSPDGCDRGELVERLVQRDC
jgi:hypothetical protein